MGMSSEEFWHGELRLAESYRKAYELKQEIKDYELWKQGMYVYEAILDASPILHAFAKRGTKPIPYTDHPYPLSDKQVKEVKKDKDREVFDKGKRLMEAFMLSNNKRFKEVRENVHEN